MVKNYTFGGSTVTILNNAMLLRDKQSIKITGKENESSQFFLSILKICSSFCKDVLGTVHGLDFEIIEGNQRQLVIGIKGASQEILMKLFLKNTDNFKPETIIHINYNESFYPIKKEYIEKNKNATKILYTYIIEKLSLP